MVPSTALIVVAQVRKNKDKMKNLYSAWTEKEFVNDLQQKKKVAETAFYNYCRVYFDGCSYTNFPKAIGDDSLFDDSFMALWTEITSRKISVIEGLLCRRDDEGEMRQMTSSLRTFLISIAKNKYREHLRAEEKKDVPMSDTDIMQVLGRVVSTPINECTLREEVVAQCVDTLPLGCKTILTAFYYEDKNLNDILRSSEGFNSKDALKTRKYKCMQSLKNRIRFRFERYHLKLSSI